MVDRLTTDEMLWDEFNEVERRRGRCDLHPAAQTEISEDKVVGRAANLDLTALCLSGGGIRSAAYCLGVVQALAKAKLLNQFDYVSSVSGGGYISGWLQMLLRDQCGMNQTAGDGTTHGGSAPAPQQQQDAAATKSVRQVLEELGDGKPPALQRLRKFTSFLTPEPGPASADTWAGITLYVRNFLLIWMVFLPLLLMVVLAPTTYRTAVRSFAGLSQTYSWRWAPAAILLLGAIVMIFATCQACILLPSHCDDPKRSASSSQITWRIVVPAIVWAYMIPFVLDYEYYDTHQTLRMLAVFRSSNPGNPYDVWLDLRKLIIPVLYFLAMSGGYRLAWLLAVIRYDPGRAFYRRNRWRWLAATTCSTALIWFGLLLASTDNPLYQLATLNWGGTNLLVDSETALTVFVPAWLIGMHALQTTFYVAFRRQGRLAELDREWLARLNGLILRTGVALAIITFGSLVLPQWLALVQDGAAFHGNNLSRTAGAATAIGAAVAWFGKRLQGSIESVADHPGSWRTMLGSPWILNGLSVVFAVLLLAFAGALMQHTLGWLQDSLSTVAAAAAATAIPPSQDAYQSLLHVVQHHRTLDCVSELTDWRALLPVPVHPCNLPAWLRGAFAYLPAPSGWSLLHPSADNFALPFVLQGIAWIVLLVPAWRFGNINVNRFSMHAIYRNRLVRAFLGTARSHRNPDRFTGFDLTNDRNDDNPRLKVFREAAATQRMFPVINTTLNITVSNDTAWAERKAACFVATPLFCGSSVLRHDTQRASDRKPMGVFVPTDDYAGKDSRHDTEGENQGATFGTMMTVSGAAVSPNWGYHSSPATAFVMTLFNVRLGAWLPNPAIANDADMQLAKPRNSLRALVSDLLGQTKDDSQAIYLTDGGHFENLAMYEMLRRRCRLLVVLDAGQDEDCKLFDLGNAIRKAAIDFNIHIAMEAMHIYPRSRIDAHDADTKDALGFAVGTIEYPAMSPDGAGDTARETGHLIYLKPSWLPNIPADVRAYGLSNPAFPHVSTVDQWFTESEFESFRALGEWQMQQLITPQVTSLEELLRNATRLAGPPK